MGGQPVSNGTNAMVFSNTSGLPVGVGGSGGMERIACKASFSTTSEVDHNTSALASVPSGAISMRNRTSPCRSPSTAVPIMLRTCWPQL